MNRLLIMTHNMQGGGCERVISVLANRFLLSGAEVLLCTEHAGPCAYELAPGVERIELSGNQRMRGKDILPVYLALRRLVCSRRPDVILALPEKVNVWTVLFLLGTGIPVVVSERNDPARHPESRLKRILRRLVYPFCDGFIFQTEAQRAYFGKSIRARGTVLDNPFEAKDPPSRREHPRPRILAAGRLHAQKGFDLLIDAFRAVADRIPDWDLVIFGEGEERTRLEERVGQAGLAKRVSLPGRTEDLAGEIAASDVFVLSSRYEGMPNALIEAMCGGLACIAADCPCGGPAAMIADGMNGLLVPAEDPAALSAALRRLCGDAALRKRLGLAATELRSRFDAKTVTEKWREYLDEIIAQKRR